MTAEYNMFRWYRSGWGRYTQSDPIGLRDSTNLFAYVGGNPLGWSDPLGMVRGKKNAPIYTTSYQDDVYFKCGGTPDAAGAAGCTDPRGTSTRCKCPCAPGGGNRLEISMTLNLHVWVRYDDPRATVSQALAEEDKHVTGWNAVFDQFIAIGETYEKVYPTSGACWNACQAFNSRFKAVWDKSSHDVDASHPNL